MYSKVCALYLQFLPNIFFFWVFIKVELMGGQMTVTSQEHVGSTFTFVLPYKVSTASDNSDDPDEVSSMKNQDASSDDITEGFFQFHPRTLGSLFSVNGSSRTPILLPNGVGQNEFESLSRTLEDSHANKRFSEMPSPEYASSVIDVAETSAQTECSLRCSSSHESVNVLIRQEVNEQDGNCEVANSTQHIPHPHAQQEVGREDNNAATISPRPSEKTGKSNVTLQCLPTGIVAEMTPKTKPKILLVEDNKINIMVTQSMMKQLGHTMDIVNNGVEAVQAVQRSGYDLILMVIPLLKLTFRTGNTRLLSFFLRVASLHWPQRHHFWIGFRGINILRCAFLLKYFEEKT